MPRKLVYDFVFSNSSKNSFGSFCMINLLSSGAQKFSVRFYVRFPPTPVSFLGGERPNSSPFLIKSSHLSCVSKLGITKAFSGMTVVTSVPLKLSTPQFSVTGETICSQYYFVNALLHLQKFHVSMFFFL